MHDEINETRKSLSVQCLPTMQGHMRRLKSIAQRIASNQELTILVPSFWTSGFNNCETSNDCCLSYFVTVF